MKSHTRAPRLLVVDDDPTILATYCEVLEACGFQVTTCARPSDAMQQYEASPKAFTAILTDYHLPEYNGVRLAWKLRSLHPERPPVFLLTGELDLRRILNEANQAGI